MKHLGCPLRYEQLFGPIKEMVDMEIEKHKEIYPDERFDFLFTHFDDEKNQWVGQIRFVNKSVCELESELKANEFRSQNIV